jgi:hypothetical protein
MRRLVALPLLLAVGLLAGCDLKDRFSSEEDRINAAMPLSLEVRQARERLLEQLAENSAERASTETAWSARLRLRAVSCSHGLQISWRQSSDEIRSAMQDKGCFAYFDQQSTRLLTLQRIGSFLADPIIASPAGAARAALSLPLPSSDTRPAKDLGLAPVLALAGMNQLELVAIDSGRSLLKERTNRSVVTSVSPNGRLFADFVADTMLRVRATESGETLMELPEANSVFWLGTQYLAVRSTRYNKPSYVIDLASGEELVLPLKEVMPGIQILPVPGHEKRLNVLSYRSIQQFEIQVADGRSRIALLAEKSTGGGFRLNPDGVRLSAGGKEWVMNRESLIRVDPVSLETRETSFAPIQLMSASPTAVADQYVVQLRANGSSNSGNGNYIYDAKQETLARVQGVAGEQTLQYYPAANRFALPSHQTLELIGTLETSTPRLAADVISAMLEESNQLRLKESEEEMRRVLQNAALSPDSPLLARMQAAQVEGLGVYEGRERVSVPGTSRPVGTVSVTVRRTTRPLVLVLSAYEAVQWKLRLEPGARLEAILLSGYYDSTVLGGGDVRVLKIGREYAYQSEGGDYQLLQRQVTRWTGRPISIFQGGYQGSSFIVGGS